MIARTLKLLPTLALCAATLVAAPAVQAKPSPKAYALNGTALVTFDPASPAGTASVPISGVAAGETLVGLDVRPANGMLYALGVDDAADTATLYLLSPAGIATPVGGSTGAIALAGLPAGDYGFDVNPAADRIRVTTSTGLNFRVNPTTGGLSGVDANINGGPGGVSGSAYTNAGSNLATATTLYSLDAGSDTLHIQNPPNAGTQTTPHALTLGGVPLNATAVPGFDIDPAVTVTTSGATATGDGYAILTVGGSNHLYKIDLATGAATDRGPVGDGSGTFRGLALQHDVGDGGRPAVGLATGGTTLRRFMTGGPAAGADVPLTGLQPGEILVGIAWRPATGQLFGLGADTTANTGTLYAIDPSSGQVTAIGTPGQVQWVGADGTTPVDLPPAQAGWDIDVNPTTDRVRVVAGGGFNARVNPTNGAPVDGNLGQPSAPVGTNPDGPHNGATTSVTGAAFTNAYAQAPSGSTTQYALDPVANRLLVQDPPNTGTLLAGPTLATGCGGAVDFDPVAPLDIPGSVTPDGFGFAYAALTVGGNPGLFRIWLPSGSVSGGVALPAPLAGLALGEAEGAEPIAMPSCLPPGPPIGPNPKPKPLPGPGPAEDRTAPRVTKLGVKARSKQRLTIAFTSSEAGKATIKLQRKATGRRDGRKRCVATRKKGARCTLYKTYKTVTKTITKAGKVSVSASGRAGALRVVVTVRDAAGNVSKAASKNATVKR